MRLLAAKPKVWPFKFHYSGILNARQSRGARSLHFLTRMARALDAPRPHVHLSFALDDNTQSLSLLGSDPILPRPLAGLLTGHDGVIPSI